MKAAAITLFATALACEALPPCPFWPSDPNRASSSTAAEKATRPTEGTPAPAHVDVWVLEHPAPDLALGALSGAVGDETLLGQLLRPGPGRSAATLVARSRLSTDGRLARTEGLVEEMYPTEFEPKTPAAEIPTSLEARNCGFSTSVQPFWTGGGLRLAVDAESVVRGPDALWPGSWPAAIPTPAFLTNGSVCRLSLPPRTPVLVSMAPVAPPSPEQVGDARSLTTRYVFARATPIGDVQPATEVSQSATFRIKLAAFRLPLASTARWLWERNPADDAAALAELVDASSHGGAPLVRASILTGSTGPRLADGPPAASVRSLVEVSHPTRYTAGVAEALDTLVTGRSLTARGTLSADGTRLLTQLGWDDIRTQAVRRWPVSPTARAWVSGAEFIQTSWESQCVLPANGTSFLGLQPVGDRGQVDALFATVQTSGALPSETSVETTSKRVEAFVVSLSEPEAQSLRQLPEGDAAAAAWASAAAGQGTVAFAASLTVGDKGAAETATIGRVPHPVRDPTRDDVTLRETEVGARLTVRPAGCELRWQTAPPVVPEGALSQIGPETPVRTFEKSVSFPVNQPGLRLVDTVPTEAPAGTPEHGRWHAVIVRVADE